MERPELTIVRGDPRRAGRAGRVATLACGALLAGAAGIATLSGAGAFREPPDADAEADAASRGAIERGGDAPEVRAALRRLRAQLGARPLDAVTRVRYAGALLDVAGEDPAVRRAATFHASRAAAISPVSLPVTAPAVSTLARAGDTDAALDLVRAMFGYDPRAAAKVLLSVEGWTGEVAARSAVPETPAATREWALALRRSGRREEGNVLLDTLVARWPEDAVGRTLAADVAAGDGRWDRFDAFVPPGLEIQPEPSQASLLALRARSRARAGDTAGARADALAAESRSEGDTGVRERGGRALLDAGDVDGARAMWTRAWWSVPPGDATRETRLRLALALARLERDHGRAGEAWRAWKAVLEIDPENEEATVALRRSGR